jgi:hypothetical protein
MYALNYLSTYLKIGIPIDNIRFQRVSEDIPSWDDAKAFLRTKSQEEQITIAHNAAEAYRQFYTTSKRKGLQGDIQNWKNHKDECKQEYHRIFSEILS